jgi:hypothetical protein
MNLKPVQIGWMLKCSIAGKHIDKEFLTLKECIDEVKSIWNDGETFVGQITFIPICRYDLIIRQR